MQAELLRHALLLALEAAAPASITVETLRYGAILAGYTVDEATILCDLEYLAEKGFAVHEACPIAMGVRRYRLTATGRDYLESRGLA